MQIKRFEAKDMTTALRRVKEELGPDAVILSARSLRKGSGFFGSLKYSGVEVSAAVDSRPLGGDQVQSRGATDPYRTTSGEGTANVRPTRNRIDPMRTRYRPTKESSRSKYRHTKKSSSPGSARALSSLYQLILQQEVDRGIASEIIDELKRIPAGVEILSDEEIKSHIALLLEDMGVTIKINPFVSERQTIMAFVGATGVGKTTTIAKLAARQAGHDRHNVGLISIDNYSITAVQQLETYARIIGIPLETAANVSDLKKALKRLQDKAIIFIDTPGVNPTDKEQIQELKANLTGIDNLKTQLVISATTKDKDCIATVTGFKDIGIDQLLFTKTDESSIFGNIVNVLIRTNLPLSFLCGGRRVPEDIKPGSVRRLVDLLANSWHHQGGSRCEAPPAQKTQAFNRGKEHAEQRYFVANKSSDVYHVTDCKWAKKIKPGNHIKFSDAQEAEAHNFLPCRSCNPDREPKRPGSQSKTEMMQFYSYR